ncbi:MAG: hypothetical protein Q7R30_01020 [Acidobacteriota bacterium]|nr:hypothetical protein [Acidobacteriota bacterium]
MRALIQWFGVAVLIGATQVPENIEQSAQGTRPPAAIVESFDGLGVGFEGPQGTASLRNPSDNSLAVGPDHVVQTVNSRMAIFTKKGKRFETTGRVLYGPVNTNNVFRGFGGACEERNNGDAVVRYDQLAGRWLIVMPIFTPASAFGRADSSDLRRDSAGATSRGGGEPDQPPVWTARDTAYVSPVGRANQPGPAVDLYQPPAPLAPQAPTPLAPQAPLAPKAPEAKGPFSMCYALSTSDDPLGAYYRYEFLRPLFPDYPRPAVWPDGYYVPTSTGDEVIEKHACVVERSAMLDGKPAREQCFVINDVNFLNNADLDGTALPRRGAPNVMMAAGGTQLKQMLGDDVVLAWKFYTDWDHVSKTRLDGPLRIPVAPYQYLCGGQLTNCVPQPGVDRKLDAQGDKIMARLVYRRIGDRESIVGVHSVNTAAGGGGVRWYEFRLDRAGNPVLHQQGTYAAGPLFRWMASPAIDKNGNIGIGYSFGGNSHFAGQRFAARLANDPPGVLGVREAVLVEGEAAQTTTLRWEDYTQMAIDPADDCTIWYVGDYLKHGAASYSTRIGAIRLPGCTP